MSAHSVKSPRENPATASVFRPSAQGGEVLRNRMGRFTLLRLVGEGGMGSVYEGYDPLLERRVAIKVLHHADENEGQGEPARKERLIREAKSLARFSHPNIVAIYDVFHESDGAVFLAMEFVRGRTLREILRDKSIPVATKLAYLLQAGEGLAAAHAAGLVHRDFKPENVVVGDDGLARVLDFGLARLESRYSSIEPLGPKARIEAESRASVTPLPSSAAFGGQEIDESAFQPTGVYAALTKEGAIVGTPAYMSPEQLRGGICDAQSDVFAFGCTMFETICGHRPFPPLATSHRLNAIRSPSLQFPKEVPSWLAAIVVRALAYAPQERGNGIASMLEAIAAHHRYERHRRKMMMAAGVVLAIGGTLVGGWLLPSQAAPIECRAPELPINRVWNQSQARSLERAFLQTPSLLAGELWHSAHDGIVRWRDKWISAHASLCTEPQNMLFSGPDALAQVEVSHRERIRTCLDQRLAELHALLGVWRVMSPERVLEAPAAVLSLGDPLACQEPENLARQAPLPVDPQARVRAKRLFGSIVATQVYAHQGDIAAASKLLASTNREVHELGDLALSAEYHRARAEIARLERRDVEQSKALDQSALLAVASGYRYLASRVTMNQFFVHSYSLHETHDRFERMAGAEAALRGAGAPADLAHELARLRALLVGMDGELARTLQYLKSAYRLAQRAYGPLNVAGAKILGDLGVTAGYLGRWSDAKQYLFDAWSMRVRVLGEAHPDTISTRSELGRSHLRLGEIGAALFHGTEAASLAAQGFANASKQAECAETLGHLYEQAGYFDASADSFAKLLEMEARLGARIDTTANWAQTHLARVALAKGQLAAAAQWADGGLEKLVAEGRVNQDPLIAALLTQAATLPSEASRSRAEKLLREASMLLELPRADRLALAPEMESVRADLSMAHEAWPQARLAYDRALAAEEQAYGPPQKLARRLAKLAWASARDGQRAWTLDAIAQAESVMTNVDGLSAELYYPVLVAKAELAIHDRRWNDAGEATQGGLLIAREHGHGLMTAVFEVLSAVIDSKKEVNEQLRNARMVDLEGAQAHCRSLEIYGECYRERRMKGGTR
jgi:hypothetical protein